MKGRNLPTLAWVLLGILIIAAMSIGLGRSEYEAVPSSTSYLPSGTRALGELLKAEGYVVKSSRLAENQFSGNEIPIAFEMTGRWDEKATPISVRAMEEFSKYLSSGGRGILLEVPRDFESATKTAVSKVVPVTDFGGKGGRINVQTDEAGSSVNGDSLLNLGITYDETGLAQIEARDKGRALVVSDGIIATNRFISMNDNAAELLRWIETLAPKGSTLIFDEATIGTEQPPGLLETIGNWALASWWQMIFLFLVIVYTLGKPFGLPDEERPIQRGARELVDAAAQTFRRSRATDIAMALIMKDVDIELRARLNLPSDVPVEERNRLLPGDLGITLKMAEAASHERIDPYQALGLAKRLEQRLAEYLGQPKALRRKKKKAA